MPVKQISAREVIVRCDCGAEAMYENEVPIQCPQCEKDWRGPVEDFKKKPVEIQAVEAKVPMVVVTLEGEMVAQPGDMIITGVKGERYPCKPDIFKATYDKLTHDEQVESLETRKAKARLGTLGATGATGGLALLATRKKEKTDDQGSH